MRMPTDVRETVPRHYYSAEMVRSLPDDGSRYETAHGELLVTPAPRAWHQELVAGLLEAIRAYPRQERAGHLLCSPADISWGPDTLVQPDLFVVPLAQARTLDWAAMQDLKLVVEVLSPSSSRADRFTKRRLYQEQRIWHPSGAREVFTLALEELFQPI